MRSQHDGLTTGLAAAMAFGLTLPITKTISDTMHPLLIGPGRAAVAGIAAAGILAWRGKTLPCSADRKRLFVIASGVVLGFPIFSAWAMRYVAASHAGVIVGILPLLTALFATFLSQERPAAGFWVASLSGGALIIYITLPERGLVPDQGDSLLLLAALSAALGYALGGQLATSLPGWEVICWALVLALPLTLPTFLWQVGDCWRGIDAVHWLGFLYLALISQLLGFFLWYHGLAMGGVAKISQLQLLQPFVTLSAAWLWMGEPFHPKTLFFAGLVIVAVATTQQLRLSTGESR